MDSIEEIRKQTQTILFDTKLLLDQLYSKKFTFELLDKTDPINAIIGLYASCCATIMDKHYGQEIAEAVITEDNFQNLVVRNEKGQIIGKATIYLDDIFGYAVVNEFDIDEKYKAHETIDIRGGSGRYTVSPDSPDEQERDLIFNAFMRGIHAFVAQYDAENPNNPIVKVNVGMGHNKLKRQCEQFMIETQNLTVPSCFYDAKKGQHILYERDTSHSNNHEGGRQL